jgi:hypothetical protein
VFPRQKRERETNGARCVTTHHVKV